jgi:hypothetical protein
VAERGSPSAGRKEETMKARGMTALIWVVLGLSILPSVGKAAGERWVSLGADSPQDVRVAVLESDANHTVIDLSFPGFLAEEQKIRGTTYHRISVPGCGALTEEGKPQLPVLARLVAIPDDRDVTLRVIEAGLTELAGFNIVPAQKPLPEGVAPRDDWSIDQGLYRQTALFPATAVETGKPGIMRDFRVVELRVYPVRANPARQQLSVCNHLKIELRYDSAASANIKEARRRAISRAFDPLYERYIVNYDQAKGGRDLSEGGSYLIITHDSFYGQIQQLASWKHQKGLHASVAKLSQIGSGETDIYNYILEAYTSWDIPPEYVLLVGDVEYLPTHYGMSSCATDHYYSKLEGSDYFSDVLVGRLPVKTTTEADYLAWKQVSYETDPYLNQTGWFTGATLVGGHESGRPWENTCLRIRSILLANGYTRVDTLFERSALATPTNINNALNDGRGVIQYRGHGLQDGWYNVNPDYTSGYILQLVNGRKLPIVMSQTCDTGWFDWSSDCMGEVWLKAGTTASPRGAVGFFGSSRPSYTGYNDTLSIGFYLGVFDSSFFHFAQATNNGKLYMYEAFPYSSTTELTFEMFNVLGDPELPLWTAVPATMAVTHEDTILTFPAAYEVTVRRGGNPVPGALVCLEKNPEIYATGYTNASGQVTLQVSPTLPGTAHLTVTARNLVPYRADVAVVSPSGPYVVFREFIIDDDNSGTSAGNSSAAVNPGESIELPVLVKNVGVQTALSVTGTLTVPGGDPYITVTDATESFGDIPAGDSIWTLDDFDFTVSPSCPHNHQINFHLDLAASNGNWTADFSVLVSGITVTATPDQTSVPRGGTLGVTLDLYNHTTAALSVDRWADVYVPNGNPYPRNPVIGPTTVSVPALSTTSAHFNLRVPRNARLGLYTMCGRAGTYPGSVVDEDCFAATVTP